MKIFPYYWGRPEAEFEVVGTPEEPCAQCDVHFTKDDLGVMIPHFFGPATAVDPGGVAELPWHRRCLLESIGIVEEVDDVFFDSTYLVDKLKKENKD